ncbi:MAG TPA: hypothetical protein PLO50_06720 [Nitrospira sp.]|nr:hypothetical protein [Nitrospira sp.]
MRLMSVAMNKLRAGIGSSLTSQTLPNMAASNPSAPADSAGKGLDLYVEFIAVLAAR